MIDPQRDIDRYLELAEREGLTITAVAETHIHADFLSGAREFAERGVRVYLSDEGDGVWKYRWARTGGYDVEFLRDRDVFRVGNVAVEAVHTPGHTPEHLSFVVTDLGGGASEPIGIVTGDFVFVGDLGRPDLLETAARIAGMQEPSARRLFGSVQRFLTLPDFLQVWPGHGAGSACGRALGAVPQSTVGYERRFNASIDAARAGEDAFVRAILDGQPEPPLYFARMKHLNNEGAPVLQSLPAPERLDADDLQRLVARGAVVFIDTRLDRSAFMAGHLPGSLYAPLDSSFSTSVGSMVVDQSAELALVVDEEHLDEAVRHMVRIGLDHVTGYVQPDELHRYVEAGGRLATIPHVRFEDLEKALTRPGTVAMDVRFKSEFDAGHIPGALHVPHTRLADRLDEIPVDRTILVHCASGARSAVAASLLAHHGYCVEYVDGSFAEWARRQPVSHVEEAV